MAHKRIVICAKGGGGKDYLKKLMSERGFVAEVSYTTRPKRSNEIEGVHYHYITPEEFQQKIIAGEFYQWKEFNGWRYGTTITEWNSKDLFIMTPSGITEITPEDRKQCLIIYIDIAEDVRKERLAARVDADATDRRLTADELDFKDFKDYDIRITNPDF